jgi:DNA invertase Pin-like site-specific DNA recombinase
MRDDQALTWRWTKIAGPAKEEGMARGKKYQPEQAVNLLRQIEVLVANGNSTEQASREAGIVEQTYYRWCKEYGGLQVDQARRLKELEQENGKLKRLLATHGNAWPSLCGAGSTAPM